MHDVCFFGFGESTIRFGVSEQVLKKTVGLGQDGLDQVFLSQSQPLRCGDQTVPNVFQQGAALGASRENAAQEVFAFGQEIGVYKFTQSETDGLSDFIESLGTNEGNYGRPREWAFTVKRKF